MSRSAALVWMPVHAAAVWLTGRGDGHGVLVLPGLGANDVSTVPLRTYLASRGYDVHGWGLGVHGGQSALIDAAAGRRLQELVESSGAPVSLVGWSLGGMLACTLARRHPHLVRQVITLGSPHRHTRGLAAVPLTSIYSRTDRIVSWRHSLITETATHHNVEVHGGHLGLATNPAVLHAIIDRLTKNPSTPFGPPTLRSSRLWRTAYPDPTRPS